MAKKKRVAAVRKSNLWSALRPGPANFVPLSPIAFLPRAAEVYPDRIAVVHGGARITYAQFFERARRLASALARRGVKRGDVVSAMLPNVPAMLDAHYGVPMLGAVLNTINTRLDADTVAYILGHGEAKVLIADRVFAGVVGPALQKLKRKPLMIEVDDPLYTGPGERLGKLEYEAFLRSGSADFA
ncbi:MAG: AMP-binding protein, partial [Betaproteobacteria bacterium]|nr:AMP-binding protein [Betaproteobacteria bacterium]